MCVFVANMTPCPYKDIRNIKSKLSHGFKMSSSICGPFFTPIAYFCLFFYFFGVYFVFVRFSLLLLHFLKWLTGLKLFFNQYFTQLCFVLLCSFLFLYLQYGNNKYLLRARVFPLSPFNEFVWCNIKIFRRVCLFSFVFTVCFFFMEF